MEPMNKMPLEARVQMLILTLLAAFLLAVFGAQIHTVLEPIQKKEATK